MNTQRASSPLRVSRIERYFIFPPLWVGVLAVTFYMTVQPKLAAAAI